LRIEYDVGRLLNEQATTLTGQILCHARFHPGGQECGDTLQVRPVALPSSAALTSGPGV
jgi:hypothetical protein